MRTYRYILALPLLLAGILLSASCRKKNSDLNVDNSQKNLISEMKVDKKKAIEPHRIEVSVYFGHSHLSGEQPQRGQVFWSRGNSGFHANPDTRLVEFPLKSVQTMVFERQKDGSYKITDQGTDAFRVVSTSLPGGIWNALVVQMFDKDGKRLDLDYKTEALRDRAQVFYTVSNVKPLSQEHKLPSVQEAPLQDYFYFWYFDRAKDNILDAPETLKTPVGFRGVIKHKVPYATYNVDLGLTLLESGKGKQEPFANSISPSGEQKKALIFKLSIPFRNITYGLGEVALDPYDDNYDELHRQDYVRYFEDLHREFPKYSVEEIEKLYEESMDMPVEGHGSHSFWL